jgi:GTPase
LSQLAFVVWYILFVKFIDEVLITVSSGHGGPGVVSFKRESMAPRGGPDGGDGGRGGHVYFRVRHQLNTLLQFRFRKKHSAESGHAGRGKNQTGLDGQDLYLEVPPGTVVRDSETKEILADLATEGDHLFLKGGRGGKGNWYFRTSVNQAPEHAQPGEDSERRDIKLELKLIADVGVLGYPNAGKSTLISSISAAKPKIADYPFTTLTPHLGVVSVSPEQSFVIADIPGLVPGAHKGVGLGTQFLRHIERTNLFVHLIDASGISGRDPAQDYLDINNELVQYDIIKAEEEGHRTLADRPQIVVLNKIDTLKEDDLENLKSKFKKLGVDVMLISAATGQGLKNLVFASSEMITRLKETP